MHKRLYIIVLFLLFATYSHAQYYSWGADPSRLKWREIESSAGRFVFPDSTEYNARATMFYAENLQQSIGYGFAHSWMPTSFVFHPENMQSNGLVAWMPKRVELMTTPDVDNYSTPWAKHLIAHEYRHVVQFNNINRNTIKVLSGFFGQQIRTVAMALIPLWQIEGDAVMMETESSSFGRGLQPSFNMAYRASGDFANERKNIDKWFCGSYKTHIPDHYQLGYQMCAYAYDKYEQNIFDKVYDYASKYPFFIFPTAIALKRNYNTTETKLFRETFTDLRRYWDSLPKVGNSSRNISTEPVKSYTKYEHPIWVDSLHVVALKTDFDRPSRFVMLDINTGKEQRIAYTGSVSSRPALDKFGVLWWTEFRRSALAPEQVNSQLCYMKLDVGKPRTAPQSGNILYPTPVNGDVMTWVEYLPSGIYRIAIEESKSVSYIDMPRGREIHGLAYDSKSNKLYFLATDNSGMWIGSADFVGNVEQLTQGAYVTLSNLRADRGVLLFGSIQSGKDEVHALDLESLGEYRISTSEYGSFAPSGVVNGKILMTTYAADGYLLSSQQFALEDTMRVAYRHKPINLVNPKRKGWNVVNVDTLDFSPQQVATSHQEHKSDRYYKSAHNIDIHSWFPISMDFNEVLDENKFSSINWGVTLLSQNLLSTTTGYGSYGWQYGEGSKLRLGFTHYLYGLNINVDVLYGGNRLVYQVGGYGTGNQPVYQISPMKHKHFSVNLGASLPIYFPRGYHTRALTLSTNWSYSNGLVADLKKIEYGANNTIANIEDVGYKNGLHKLSFAAAYSDLVRLAYRDFLPRWGYSLSASYSLNPSNRDFSDLMVLYARAYLPGIGAHNSLSIEASYQNSFGGFKTPVGDNVFGYKSTRLLPRGFTTADILSRNYISSSLNYQLPVWYPEGGIPSVIYFKRIRLNLGVDYATFQGYTNRQLTWRNIYSYGGDITFDLNIVQMPSSGTIAVRLSVYAPSKGGVFVGGGLELPF